MFQSPEMGSLGWHLLGMLGGLYGQINHMESFILHTSFVLSTLGAAFFVPPTADMQLDPVYNARSGFHLWHQTIDMETWRSSISLQESGNTITLQLMTVEDFDVCALPCSFRPLGCYTAAGHHVMLTTVLGLGYQYRYRQCIEYEERVCNIIPSLPGTQVVSPLYMLSE